MINNVISIIAFMVMRTLVYLHNNKPILATHTPMRTNTPMNIFIYTGCSQCNASFKKNNTPLAEARTKISDTPRAQKKKKKKLYNDDRSSLSPKQINYLHLITNTAKNPLVQNQHGISQYTLKKGNPTGTCKFVLRTI